MHRYVPAIVGRRAAVYRHHRPISGDARGAAQMTLAQRASVVGLAALVYALIRWTPGSAGLSDTGQAVLAITGAGTVLWMSEAVPIGVSALAILALLGSEHDIGPAQGFAGFASEVTIFMVGIAGICAAVETSGLAQRAARMLLRIAQGNPSRLYWQMIAAFPVLALLLPSSMARNAILLPSYENAFRAMGAGPSTGLKRAVTLALGMLNPLASSALLTGGLVSVAAASLLGEFSWLRWFYLMAPPYYALMIAGAAFVKFMVGTFEGGSRTDDLGTQRQPLSRNEAVTLAVLAGTCLLWLSDSVHKLSPAIPALVGAVILQLPWIGAVTWKQVESRLSWNLILTIAAAMSLAGAMTKTGAATWLGHRFVEQLPNLASHPLLFIVGLITATTIVHLAVTNLVASVSLLLPVTVTVAQAAGLNPVVCGLIVTLNINAVILYPAQTAVNLLAYDAGYFSASDVRRLGLAMLALNIIVVLCAIPYWALLGLPLVTQAG